MIRQDWMVIVAGEALVDALTAEQKATCKETWGGNYVSEDVVEMQQRQSRRGILGVEIIISSYGHSIRYDSGLQDFGLVRSGRGVSLEDAEAWCRGWVAQDPQHRYAWRRKERAHA